MIRPRLHIPVAQLNHDWAEGKRIPLDILNDFIDSVDASCIEERIAELSPELRKSLQSHCWVNILAFDSVIAETIALGYYVDGWIALRDWARRQPWAEEARIEMEPVMAENRRRLDAMKAADQSAPNLSEQGRMLGILRVHLMRATTDEERAEISKQLEELTKQFEELNRA